MVKLWETSHSVSEELKHDTEFDLDDFNKLKATSRETRLNTKKHLFLTLTFLYQLQISSTSRSL